MSMVSKAVALVRYPVGIPEPADFRIQESPLAKDIADGEVLVKNLFMSVDPYMRGRMTGKRSYVDPFKLGEPLDGGAVGEVVASRRKGFAVGDHVIHAAGWRTYHLANAQDKDLRVLPKIEGVSPGTWLGTLGMPGMTAYVGLLKIAGLKAGERVFVSGAAGAVGSLVGQIAKTMGCFVVGSVGSAEKQRYLKEELGFDVVLNYKDAPIVDQLQKVRGEGFDVYFDNVGGDHLDAALICMKDFGRIVACGAISQYNSLGNQSGITQFMQIVAKRLTMRGFIVSDHNEVYDAFVQDMGRWLKEGKVHDKATVYQGIDQAVAAFRGLFLGENVGKALVAL